MMKKLFSNNKQKQTFAEDTKLSPILDPNQAPKTCNINAFKIEDSYQQPTRFQFSVKNNQNLFETSAPQFGKTYKEEMIGIDNTPTFNNTPQQLESSGGRVGSKLTQCSPQKVWQLAGNIFNKHLAQIKSTNQSILTPQQSLKLKEKIMKHINDCISLIKLQLKYKQRSCNPHAQQPSFAIQLSSITSQICEIEKQTPTQNQNTPIDQENSTTSNTNEESLDLFYFCIQAFEQLSKDQTNLQDTITLMEKLFKILEGYPEVMSLPCIKNLQLNYAQNLLHCGLLKKVERCLIQLEPYQSISTHNPQEQKEKKNPLIMETCPDNQKALHSSENPKKYDQKILEEFDLSKYFCLYCEYLKEQGEIDHCIEQSNSIQNPRKIEAFLLKIGILIERNQLEQALYLIEQGKQLFSRHKQPILFLQLMNQKLKIMLMQGQYNTIHSMFQEMKEFFEQSNLRYTLEFCQILIYESQAYLNSGFITESIMTLEDATLIAKEILKDRYNQSSIIGDIYHLKALSWYQQSQTIQDEEERNKLLKHALSICQLCIKIRKNYLYAKSDKNHKVIETLSLHVNLLAATNQNREYRKASAELVEYELI